MQTEKLSRADAIKKAIHDVYMYKFSNQYVVTIFDPKAQAWRGTHSQPYPQARSSTGAKRIEIANLAMQEDEETVNKLVCQYLNNGGKWTDYV